MHRDRTHPPKKSKMFAGGAENARRLPEGCSASELRPYFATVEGYGGDADGRPTVLLRCICSFRSAGGNNVMVSDHNWLAGEDAAKVIALALAGTNLHMARTEDGRRPKRGTKLFLTGKVVFYGDGAQPKAKVALLDRVELRPFEAESKQKPYWIDGGKKEKNSPLWHGA